MIGEPSSFSKKLKIGRNQLFIKMGQHNHNLHIKRELQTGL